MFVIGLTGSVGMGKTTTADMFRAQGVPVQDADLEVHRLMARGGAAVPAIAEAFPAAVKDGAVDRTSLGAVVFKDAEALKRLEAILHPMVAARRLGFLERAARRGATLAVLDVPLLFETGGDRNCDLTVLVTAPHFVQAARFLRRPGATWERLQAIRAKQMPDRAKRRLADIVIQSGCGRAPVLRAVTSIVRTFRGVPGAVWPPRGAHRPGHRRPAVLSSLRKA